MNTKTKLSAAVLAITATTTLSISGPAEADHQGQDRTYPSCKSLNRDFKHGVGRRGAVDKTSSERVTNFTRNTRVYLLNDGPRTPGAAMGQGQYDLDRDNDGIACEKL
ncbi:excalibur calcium-binding domain-containing protein [Nocardioides iriomotensis]|uniref:Excalibur calcium-binding domain-containing protein n=1 Tax=Nocardioides iriomotensis TaxID=715784 RepID=A0A4Q5J9Y3_9ACTN|nr:excalibur calcium-binding domain-containing protein [Nocardioides iriomotensis]RYU14818.1 excalibur calcium-binding domain-containing protein [Nocardioides iriomotensis]